MSNPVSQFIKGSRLRNRFLVLFAVLVTAPLLALGFTALFLVNTSQQQNTSRMHTLLLQQKTEEIDKFFADTLGILNIQIPEIAVTEEGVGQLSREQQEFFLEGFLSTNPSFQSVAFVDIAEQRLASALERGGDFEFSIRYLTPTEISSVRFQNPAEAGEKFIGEIYYDGTTPMIPLSAPVVDGAGNVFYVLYAEASLGQIVNSIQRVGLGSSGYLALADETGLLVAQGSSAALQPGNDISEYTAVQRALAGEVFDGSQDKDRYKSVFGDVSVVGAAKIVSSTGWVLLSEWPLSEADAVLENVRDVLLQIVIFGAIAVFVLASVFATGLVRPIRRLEQAAQEVEKGNFDTQVSFKTGDELEELGGTFNKMTKGLKRLQELKDEFVFVAAHELRSPVTVIKGYISMILEGSAGKISSQAQDFIQKTQMANDRLNRLVEDLLEIARSEAGRLEIKTAPTDMTQTTRIAVEELRPLANAKQITLTYYQTTNLPQVMADVNRIKEVLVNLAGNAIKYSPEGAKVDVFHEVRDGEVITHVRDNGFGISKDAQKKLFEKFYRVQTERTKNITGTGLGLFIVKQIVEKMGGKIWFVSEEGRGSVFSFSLLKVK